VLVQTPVEAGQGPGSARAAECVIRGHADALEAVITGAAAQDWLGCMAVASRSLVRRQQNTCLCSGWIATEFRKYSIQQRSIPLVRAHTQVAKARRPRHAARWRWPGPRSPVADAGITVSMVLMNILHSPSSPVGGRLPEMAFDLRFNAVCQSRQLSSFEFWQKFTVNSDPPDKRLQPVLLPAEPAPLR